MIPLPPECDQRIHELVDTAPPIPAAAQDLIRLVFAGRIAAARNAA